MSRFFNYLVEARRNPDQNKKIGLVQALEPYKDKGDYFIQFSDNIGSITTDRFKSFK